MNISRDEDRAGQISTTVPNDALGGDRINMQDAREGTGVCSAEIDPAMRSRLDEARQFVNLALDLQRDGWSLKSGRYAKRAVLRFEQASRGDDYEAIVARLCLADSRFVRGNFAGAETDYRHALSSIDGLDGASASFDVRSVRAQALSGLANVALARGQTADAERQLLDALDIIEPKAGSSHESSATLMDDLGTLYRQTGRYDEAERIQHLALTVIEETVGIEHPQAAAILEHLAMLEHARGQFIVGERFARQAAAIQERAFGPDHPRVASAYVVLALILEKQGKLLEATQARQAAQLMAQRWFGDDLEALAGSGLVTSVSPADRRHAGWPSRSWATRSAHAV